MKHVVCLLFLVLSSGLYAQDSGKLSGTIKDQEVFDEGVAFAQVVLKDTDFATQTNFRGNFEVSEVAPGNYTLQVFYAGYETLEIPIQIKGGELTQISGAMSAKRLSLEDLSSVTSESKESGASANRSESKK